MTSPGRMVAIAAAIIACCAVAACGARGDEEVARATHVAAVDGDSEAFDRARLIRELMRRRGGDPAAAAQLVQLTRELPASDAAEMFEVLAGAHLAAGHINLAADARLLLLQTHPQTPAAAQAALWLTRLYASSEVAHRHRPADAEESTKSDQGLAMYGYSLAGEFEAAAARRTDLTDKTPRPAMGAAAENPALRFTRAVAARRAGLAKPAAALLTPLKHQRAGEPWGDCARVETWLAEDRDAARAPKPIARCTPAAEPPQLDGVLDDACWQGDSAVVVGGPRGEAMRSVQFAYDDKFLYLAGAFSQRVGVDYSANDRPRTHDGELAGRDRVTIALDADRDYATAWELTVDSRGWTGDRCWGDAAWNPEWFVAARTADDPQGAAQRPWIVEAAIPWSALAAKAPRAGAAWAIAIERTIPGTDAERWPAAKLTEKPAAEGASAGPAAFGLLLFE